MIGKFEVLAKDLAEAWQAGKTVPLPPAGHGPATRAEAYAIQDRMAELIGSPVAGWKVGATVRAVQISEGHDGPLPGRIFADRLFDSPAKIPAWYVRASKVECEFAFRLTGKLPERLTRETLAPLLDFHPAIELAGTRYAPGTGNRGSITFDGIADNGTGGAAVLGQAVKDWHRLSFETMPIEARIDGGPAIQIFSGDYRRDPVEIMVETLEEIRRRGAPFEPGMCVLTGSLSLPTPIRQGQTLVVRFADFAPLTMTMA